jgi:hypothetical protein
MPASPVPSARPPGTTAKGEKLKPTPVLTTEAALARATAYYEAGEYSGCADGFAAVLDDPNQSGLLAPRSREQARVYRAACLIAKGEVSAADDQFRLAVRENPQMAVPNAIVFPPSVLERFVIVRTELMGEIRRSEEERMRREQANALEARRRAEAERARVARLEALASQETLVVRNRRWVASVPFGVGQFQNRDYGLGALFLGAETILLGTAVAATSIELSLNSQANGGKNLSNEDQVRQLNQNIATANRIALVSTGALLLTVAGGILQANLAFVPEFDGGVRRRAAPRDSARAPRLTPVFGVLPGAAHIGVIGRF